MPEGPTNPSEGIQSDDLRVPQICLRRMQHLDVSCTHLPDTFAASTHDITFESLAHCFELPWPVEVSTVQQHCQMLAYNSKRCPGVHKV